MTFCKTRRTKSHVAGHNVCGADRRVTVMEFGRRTEVAEQMCSEKLADMRVDMPAQRSMATSR